MLSSRMVVASDIRVGGQVLHWALGCTFGTVVALGAAEPPTVALEGRVRAESLLAEAERLAAAGRSSEAAERAAQAQLAAPGDAGLGLRARRLMQAPSSAGSAALDPVVLASWAGAELRRARLQAERQAAAGRLDDAVESLVVVERAIIQHRLDDAPGLSELLAAVRADQSRYRARQADRSAKADIQAQLQDAHRDADHRASLDDRRFQESLERIRDLRDRGHLELAMARCRAVVHLHPEREEARQLLAELTEARHADRRRTLADRTAVWREELALATTRSLLPGRDDIFPGFPDDWARRTSRVDDRALTVLAEPEWKAQVTNQLAARLSLDVAAMPLLDAIDLLSRRTGVNVVVDPQVAAQDHPISITAPSLSAASALTWICQQAGTSWSVTNGAVLVGGDGETELGLVVYDVASLLHSPRDQPGRTLGLTSASEDGGTAIFEAAAQAPAGPTPEDLADLIRATCSPARWEQDGFGIIIRGTALFITASTDVHRQVDQLIRAQEAMSTMLVRVDARWVEVQDRFWEQAGVTWTVIGSPFVVPGVTDGVARQTGSSTWTGSVDRASSLPTGTIAGMTTTPFTMAISHGGPVGLSAILRAGETAGQARSLSQMSITTFNGVQGNVFDGTQLAYIGDYQIVSSTFDPQIKVVTVGRGLDVKPYVSSDRKYVTLTIQPAVSSASLFTDRIRTVRVLDGINFTDQGEDDDDEELPPATQVAEYPIEMPNVAIRKVATTATIPDRGSLLLGGFGSHQDERMSSGVPYLSDIPYLGRLFGTRARGSQRSSLYLLTTTTIIPYDELEKTL